MASRLNSWGLLSRTLRKAHRRRGPAAAAGFAFLLAVGICCLSIGWISKVQKVKLCIETLRKKAYEPKNPPVAIIAYNQLTYIRDTVRQLEQYTDNIVIVDNASTYLPLLKYYETEYNYRLIRLKKNLGHLAFLMDRGVRSILGEKFMVTDPDLQFNPNLPKTFISTLEHLSEKYAAHKVGFALNITSVRSDIVAHLNMTIANWESQFWKKRLPDDELELYAARLDTTFCFVNMNYVDYTQPWAAMKAIRVAGDFTAVHRPWMPNWESEIPIEEVQFFSRQKNDRISHWFGVGVNTKNITSLGGKFLKNASLPTLANITNN